MRARKVGHKAHTQSTLAVLTLACEGTPPLAARGISVIAHAGMAVPELQKRREENRREEREEKRAQPAASVFVLENQ